MMREPVLGATRKHSRPRRKPVAGLVLACLALLLSSAPAEEGSQTVSLSSAEKINLQSDSFYDGYRVRYGIAPGTDLKALADRTAVLGMSMTSFKEETTGKPMIRGYAEVHAVYDVPLCDVDASMWDFIGQKQIFPRLLEVRVEKESADYARIFQRVGVSILGLSVGYRMRIEVSRDHFPNGAVGHRSRLIECIDGNMFQSYSSTYMEEVTIDGKKMTYIRVFSSPGILNPFPGTDYIVKQLTPGELRDSIAITVKDARRRASGTP